MYVRPGKFHPSNVYVWWMYASISLCVCGLSVWTSFVIPCMSDLENFIHPMCMCGGCTQASFSGCVVYLFGQVLSSHVCQTWKICFIPCMFVIEQSFGEKIFPVLFSREKSLLKWELRDIFLLSCTRSIAMRNFQSMMERGVLLCGIIFYGWSTDMAKWPVMWPVKWSWRIFILCELRVIFLLSCTRSITMRNFQSMMERGVLLCGIIMLGAAAPKHNMFHPTPLRKNSSRSPPPPSPSPSPSPGHAGDGRGGGSGVWVYWAKDSVLWRNTRNKFEKCDISF